MVKWVIVICVALLVLTALVIALRFWQKWRSRRKQDKEQMDRKVREDALDRALSNKLHHSLSTQPQSPFEVRYHSELTDLKNVEMIRLTEQSESITRDYLVRMDNAVYLGEDHGRAAIFHQKGRELVIYCEIFPSENAAYVRKCSSAGGQLVRGKQRTELDSKGIKLNSGDLLELRCGTFLVEFI